MCTNQKIFGIMEEKVGNNKDRTLISIQLRYINYKVERILIYIILLMKGMRFDMKTNKKSR